ncbi:HepT-like ribonuclease domain-containing protein [Demequina iriomotensis]|uniref:HepT-like ribonuclease domain-containing protein n=1 Tax=Demequina iriomotensis TaxID=1536641 RepID=UPI00078593A2|nr:HepT-like ribonuclease domain-containing protein [Demequina iriomotensis]
MTAVPARDAERLRHVVDACERIHRYVGGSPSALDDPRTFDAVLHCLTVIGEALAHVSDATYARLGSLPPGTPKAQRNIIVHEYWRVSREVVWATVDDAVPRLLDDALQVLSEQ